MTTTTYSDELLADDYVEDEEPGRAVSTPTR